MSSSEPSIPTIESMQYEMQKTPNRSTPTRTARQPTPQPGHSMNYLAVASSGINRQTNSSTSSSRNSGYQPTNEARRDDGLTLKVHFTPGEFRALTPRLVRGRDGIRNFMFNTMMEKMVHFLSSEAQILANGIDIDDSKLLMTMDDPTIANGPNGKPLVYHDLFCDSKVRCAHISDPENILVKVFGLAPSYASEMYATIKRYVYIISIMDRRVGSSFCPIHADARIQVLLLEKGTDESLPLFQIMRDLSKIEYHDSCECDTELYYILYQIFKSSIGVVEPIIDSNVKNFSESQLFCTLQSFGYLLLYPLVNKYLEEDMNEFAISQLPIGTMVRHSTNDMVSIAKALGIRSSVTNRPYLDAAPNSGGRQITFTSVVSGVGGLQKGQPWTCLKEVVGLFTMIHLLSIDIYGLKSISLISAGFHTLPSPLRVISPLWKHFTMLKNLCILSGPFQRERVTDVIVVDTHVSAVADGRVVESGVAKRLADTVSDKIIRYVLQKTGILHTKNWVAQKGGVTGRAVIDVNSLSETLDMYSAFKKKTGAIYVTGEFNSKSMIDAIEGIVSSTSCDMLLESSDATYLNHKDLKLVILTTMSVRAERALNRTKSDSVPAMQLYVYPTRVCDVTKFMNNPDVRNQASTRDKSAPMVDSLDMTSMMLKYACNEIAQSVDHLVDLHSPVSSSSSQQVARTDFNDDFPELKRKVPIAEQPKVVVGDWAAHMDELADD